jgi:hypothetical protein
VTQGPKGWQAGNGAPCRITDVQKGIENFDRLFYAYRTLARAEHFGGAAVSSASAAQNLI